MEKNNNYFSDLNELFLQAKKEEQINVDPQTKNAVREMLKYKISEMKGNAEAASNRPDFMSMFRRWRYPMVGIPAIMATLVLMVYAAANLPLIIPKDDPAVETNESALMLAENIQEDSGLPVNIAEKDKAFFRRVTKLKQPGAEGDEGEAIELLVLDINKMGKAPITETSRDLNAGTRLIADLPTSSTVQNPDVYIYVNLPDPELEIYSPGAEGEPSQSYQPDPIIGTKNPPKVPKETYTDDVNTQSSDPVESNTSPDTAQESTFIPPMETADPVEPTQPAQPVGSGEPAEPAQPAQPTETTQPESNDISDIYVAYTAPVDPVDPVATFESAIVEAQPIATLQETYVTKEHIFIRQEITSYPVYYFSDTSLTMTPAFDESLLDNITKKSTPTSMYVYYETESIVVVEMEVDSVTKWYLFEEIHGIWTIQKYEKEITKDVVR